MCDHVRVCLPFVQAASEAQRETGRESRGRWFIGRKSFFLFPFSGFPFFSAIHQLFFRPSCAGKKQKRIFAAQGPFSRPAVFFGLNALSPSDWASSRSSWRLFIFALHDWTKVQPLSFKLLQNCSGLKHVLTPFLLGLPGSVRRIRLHLRVRRPPLLRRWSWVRGVLLQPSVRGLQVSAGDKLRGGGGGRRSVQVGTSSYSKGNF